MKNYLKNINHTAGFTLMELLIVIGILGVLAATLLATIDPFEQIKKSIDASLKETSTEFFNANVRYFTAHNALPWHTVANGGAFCYTTATPTSAQISTMGTCITALISDGELKGSFSSSSNLSLMLLTSPNPLTTQTSDLVVCFKPQSKAEQRDGGTKYAINGALGTGCKSAGGATDCYWCAQ